MEKGTVCNFCHLIKQKTYRCLGCKAIRYCGKECQTNDWLRHKEFCELLKTDRTGNFVSIARGVAELNPPKLLYSILSSMKSVLSLDSLIKETYGIIITLTRVQIEQFNESEIIPSLAPTDIVFLKKAEITKLMLMRSAKDEFKEDLPENPFTLILHCEGNPIPLHMKKNYIDGLFNNLFK